MITCHNYNNFVFLISLKLFYETVYFLILKFDY